MWTFISNFHLYFIPKWIWPEYRSYTSSRTLKDFHDLFAWCTRHDFDKLFIPEREQHSYPLYTVRRLIYDEIYVAICEFSVTICCRNCIFVCKGGRMGICPPPHFFKFRFTSLLRLFQLIWDGPISVWGENGRSPKKKKKKTPYTRKQNLAYLTCGQNGARHSGEMIEWLRNSVLNRSATGAAPAHFGLGEIDGPLVPPGKATERPSDYWLTLPRKSGFVKPSKHTSLIGLVGWLIIFWSTFWVSWHPNIG